MFVSRACTCMYLFGANSLLPEIFFSRASLYVSTFAHNPLYTDSSWRNMQIFKNVNMTHCLTCRSCFLCKSRPSCNTLAFRRRLCAARKLDAFSLALLCTRPFCCPFSYNTRNIDGYIIRFKKFVLENSLKYAIVCIEKTSQQNCDSNITRNKK